MRQVSHLATGVATLLHYIWKWAHVPKVQQHLGMHTHVAALCNERPTAMQRQSLGVWKATSARSPASWHGSSWFRHGMPLTEID